MNRLSATTVLLALTSCAVPTPHETGDSSEPAVEEVVRLLDDPLGPLPASLADVGLYTDLAAGVVDPRAVAYAPTWPLWSSGSDKQRYLVLPEGERIDNTDEGPWSFPPGTLLFKTFSYEQRIETRLLRREVDGWGFAVWQWRDDGDGGDLLEGTVPVEATVAFDGGAAEHTIPSTLMCRTCHEVAEGQVLGFTELQLGEQLVGLADLFEEAPPAHPEQIEADDLATRQVLGAMEGNCVHCHHSGDWAPGGFDLSWQVALDNTLGVPTVGSGTVSGDRIAPGHPDESVLYLSWSDTGGSEVPAMPPVGVDRVDAATVDLLREWILGLEETSR